MAYVFFDLDKTLIRGQSQKLLLNALYKRKIISFTTMWKLRFFFMRYTLNIISDRDVVNMYTTIAKVFAGADVSYIQKVIRAFVFAEFADIQNLRAVEELEKHVSAGKKIVLVSAAFEPVVEAAAKFFQIPEYLCTKLAIKNGVYTGELDGKPNYGEQKIKNLEAYDFSGSFAYSDHHSDLPLFLKATYRYAVSPTRKLRAYAKDHGWFIIE
jgi:HAD superfamily hydrolase (TIGR01490 family)